jgi:hypothetical protein
VHPFASFLNVLMGPLNPSEGPQVVTAGDALTRDELRITRAASLSAAHHRADRVAGQGPPLSNARRQGSEKFAQPDDGAAGQVKRFAPVANFSGVGIRPRSIRGREGPPGGGPS